VSPRQPFIRRLIGIDPGLRRTGWGVIEIEGTRLAHVANGTVTSDSRANLAERLCQLYEGLSTVVERYCPHCAAVEQTFVNKDPAGTLKLGQARAVALLVPARAGIEVHEYAPNQVKKALVGVGHADKAQIPLMIRTLLPGCAVDGPDAADALAVAICHAHMAQSAGRMAEALARTAKHGGARQ
jgi:crossover junction endodeoxyribonuclease RuvC